MVKRAKNDQLQRAAVEQEDSETEFKEDPLGNKEDVDTPEDIAQRKIVKIKRKVQTTKADEKPAEKPAGAFSLAAPLSSEKKDGEEKPKSLFGNGANAFSAAPKSGSLFGGTTSGTSLFGNAPKSGSLFGNSTTTSTSLFGGTTTGSLFGNPPKGQSLFDSKNSLFGG